MSSPDFVCGALGLGLAAKEQEVEQTHFVPGFADPQKRNWKEGVETKNGGNKMKSEGKESEHLPVAPQEIVWYQDVAWQS